MESLQKTNPTVSVVIAAYNRPELMESSIKSILDQTFGDLEIIIVNDASPNPKTKEVMEKWAAQDKRIRTIYHEKNQGPAGAFWTGIKSARGKYVAIQTEDDLWLPEKLEAEIKIFQSAAPDVGIVYSVAQKTMLDGRKHLNPPPEMKNKEGDLYKALLKGNFITPNAALFKRECFEKVPIDPKSSGFEDWDYLLRMSQIYKFRHNPQKAVEVKLYDNSFTANQFKRLTAREYFFEKHLEEYKKYPSLLAENAFTIGHTFALRGDMKKARHFLGLAMRAKPTLKRLISYFLSLFSSKTIYRMPGAISKSLFRKGET